MPAPRTGLPGYRYKGVKVSAIEARARSLANISSSKAISHDDVDSSANESWKDIYARLLERDDDYWVMVQAFSSITAYATSNPNEYKIPLPSDFYKLRSVDWQGSTWRQMHRFPMSMRNDQPAEPHYRFDSTYLWIVGANVSQVRIRYYPPPDVLTHPDTDLQFATAVTPDNFSKVSSPVYASWKNTGVYIYNVQNIAEGSIDDNTTGAPVTLLAAAANLSNLVYYKGYLYWLQGGIVKRAPTDLKTTPIVPANVIATATVTSFAIFKDIMYYTDAGAMYTATLAGGGSALLLAATVGTWISVAGGIVFYVLAGALKSVSPVATVIASGISACVSDGTNLYVLDTSGNLRRITVSSTPALLTDTTLRTDILSIGPWYGNRIPMLTGEGQQMLAVSSIVDTDITYPANVLTELVAFQMAIDFKTKLGEDFAALKLRLGDPDSSPATGLWASFKKLAKRDEYEPERIKNSRATSGSML
jgi:hypothetical protein